MSVDASTETSTETGVRPPVGGELLSCAEGEGDIEGEREPLLEDEDSERPATNMRGTCWASSSIGYEFIGVHVKVLDRFRFR